MILITTEGARDSIMASMNTADPEKVNENGMKNPFPGISTWGIRVLTLPDSAFQGLETDEGEPSDGVVTTYKQQQRLLPYWEGLKAGDLRLVDLPLDFDAPSPSLVDAFMTAQKLKSPERHIPFPAPITPAVNQHLTRLVDISPTKKERERTAALRNYHSNRLCIVLLKIAIKKSEEGEGCDTQ